jgi:hypothetical protein
MLRCKRNKFLAPVVEERVGSNDHRICATLQILRENHIEFLVAGGSQCLQLKSDGPRCFL